ncbi:hypothetical protein ACFX1S_022442 [Malus domestica]
MTGESEHVEVNGGQNPFLYSRTKVVDGYGQMLVALVGMNSTWGEMMSLGLVGRYFTDNAKNESEFGKFEGSKAKIDDVVNVTVNIVAVAVVVVIAILEGFPFAVTFTLTYSMKRMIAEHSGAEALCLRDYRMCHRNLYRQNWHADTQ